MRLPGVLLAACLGCALSAQTLEYAFLLQNSSPRHSCGNAAGEFVITGEAAGVSGDFNIGAPVVNLPAAATIYHYVAKYSANGDLRWVRQVVGGEGYLFNYVCMDDQGNVYMTGRYCGTVDFDPGPAVHALATAQPFEACVVKWDADGNYLWAVPFVGRSEGRCIAVDPEGAVWSSGSAEGTVDFDPGPQVHSITSPFGAFYISKLDQGGNYLWAGEVQPAATAPVSYGAGIEIALDGAGAVYVSGKLDGRMDFDPGPAAATADAVGAADAFVLKLDDQGNYLWHALAGGTGNDVAFGLCVDSAGGVIAAGSFNQSADFDPGPGQALLTATPGFGAFFWRLSPSGGLVSARHIEGLHSGFGRIARAGHTVAAVGMFTSWSDSLPAYIDVDPASAATTFNAVGGGTFVGSYTENGDLNWAVQGPSSNGNGFYGVAVDQAGTITAYGLLKDNFDADPGVAQAPLWTLGEYHSFVWRVNSQYQPQVPPAPLTQPPPQPPAPPAPPAPPGPPLPPTPPAPPSGSTTLPGGSCSSSADAAWPALLVLILGWLVLRRKQGSSRSGPGSHGRAR